MSEYNAGRRLAARVLTIPGLGHAWSGGDSSLEFFDGRYPDPTELAWEFFDSAPPQRLAAPRTLRRFSGPMFMDNFTVTLRQGETLLDGALKIGAALAHDCGGKLAGMTCCVENLMAANR